MKKRALPFILALAVVLSALSGCSGSGSSSQPSSASQTSSAVQPASKELDWFINLSWMTNPWGKDWVSAQIAKETGLKVNVIVPPAGGENARLTTMIASGQLPDLMTLNWSDPNINQMITANMLTPLKTLADKYSPDFYKYADPDVLTWNTQPDGNVYGYNDFTTDPSDVKSNPNVFSNYAMWVREDIYNAIGKPDMTTTQGFLKALQDAKAKYPKVENGTLIPFGGKNFNASGDENGSLTFTRELQDFLAIPYQTSDGKIYDRKTDPEYLRWLKMFREATAEKLIPADDFANNSDQISTNVQNGRYFCMLDQWIDYTQYVQTWDTAHPNEKYIAIPGPKNSNGANPTLSAGTPNGWLQSVIPSSAKHPDAAIKFLTYMLSPGANELVNAGIEGKTFTKTSDGKYQMTKDYSDMIEKDAVNAQQVTGVNTWQFFCSTAQSLDYFDATTDSTRLIRDWNKPYGTYTGAFEFTPFAANSPEAIAQNAVYTLWDTTLPKLLRAGSDSEFDSIMQSYLSQRTKDGYDTMIAAEQKQFDANNAKIAKFTK